MSSGEDGLGGSHRCEAVGVVGRVVCEADVAPLAITCGCVLTLEELWSKVDGHSVGVGVYLGEDFLRGCVLVLGTGRRRAEVNQLMLRACAICLPVVCVGSVLRPLLFGLATRLSQRRLRCGPTVARLGRGVIRSISLRTQRLLRSDMGGQPWGLASVGVQLESKTRRNLTGLKRQLLQHLRRINLLACSSHQLLLSEDLKVSPRDRRRQGPFLK